MIIKNSDFKKEPKELSGLLISGVYINPKMISSLTDPLIEYIGILNNGPFGTKLLCQNSASSYENPFLVLELPSPTEHRESLQKLKDINYVSAYDCHYSVALPSFSEPFDVIQRRYISGITLNKLGDVLSPMEKISIQERLFNIVGEVHNVGLAGIDIRRSNVIISGIQPWLFDFDIYFNEGVFDPLFKQLKQLDYKDIETIFKKKDDLSFSAQRFYDFARSLDK